jgi:PhnB protein
MAKKVKTVPEGYNSVTPYMTIKNAAKAIEYYKKIFGAVEVMRISQPDGRVGHAELKIGDSKIMICDEFPNMGARGPEAVGGTPVSIHLYIADVDDVVKRAVAAGAKATQPMQDKFYGDRAGGIIDPFGHSWYIATHTEDMSMEEMQLRAEEFTKKQAS